jgi:hypothetical protein
MLLAVNAGDSVSCLGWAAGVTGVADRCSACLAPHLAGHSRDHAAAAVFMPATLRQAAGARAVRTVVGSKGVEADRWYTGRSLQLCRTTRFKTEMFTGTLGTWID